MSHTSDLEAIVNHHVQALQQEDVVAILQDYADDAAIVTQTAVHKGRDELRKFFTETLKIIPEGFWDVYTVTQQVIIGDILYDVWEAKPWFPCGTDTLLFRNGKILVQTGAMFVPPAEE